MTRLTTDNTPRFCSRCLKELTDPASRECGVGPICRAKDNHLYAKAIKANLPVAGALVLGTKAEMLPIEIQGRFEAFKSSFTVKTEKTQKLNDDATKMKISGGDFRAEIHELDYFLSYQMDVDLRNRMIKIVEALGYIGLAGVLSGDASTSKAKVWFENGKIYLSGTGCTSGYNAMKKIPGITTPRYRGDRIPYSAPASEFAPFLQNVQKFWPMYEADLEEIKNQAQQWTTKNIQSAPGPSTTAPGPKTATAQISHRTDDFVLSFPWVKEKDMYGLIDDLKKIPNSGRKYDPGSKSWNFQNEHLAHVRRYLEKYFPDFIEEKTDKQTPPGNYTMKAKKRVGRKFRSRY